MLENSHLPPTSIVIFGGTGDLAKTKLFPALLDLYVAGQLPEKFHIIGLSRKSLSNQEYQSFIHDSIIEKSHNRDDQLVHKFCSKISYVSGSFDDFLAYDSIKQALKDYDSLIGQCTNKLFYLAVPPQYYETIFEHLHDSSALALCDEIYSWSRLLVEKPFGKNLDTAQVLEKKLCSLFADEQIYRIDHYLAKDAIENILALRFANSVLADSWNSEAVESIKIRLLESKDVSNRGAFYDAIGTLRDVGQNHMLQIFALLTMRSADIYDAKAIRESRAKALEILSEVTPDTLTRGQYNGYKEVEGVASDSDTETYFNISLTLNKGDWQGTNCVLEAGKALNKKASEAIITFKPHHECETALGVEAYNYKNVLRIKFAPEYQINLTMWTKEPGFEFKLRQQTLELAAGKGEESNTPEAYERVLFDCIAGNQTRFVSGREVELAWKFITPILDTLDRQPLKKYDPGSTGPDVE